MARVGVDLDGVCYDFGEALKKFLVEHEGFDENLMTVPKIWDFFLEWGLSLDTYLDYYQKGVDAGVVFVYGDPHEGCLEYMTKLKEDGHTLHIVTYRTIGDKAVENTMHWLKREQIPYDSISFSKDKTIIANDYFIEDNLDNYAALEQAGIGAFLMDRPWNASQYVSNRVFSWDQFYWEIKARTK
jgi:hypothetical protein